MKTVGLEPLVYDIDRFNATDIDSIINNVQLMQTDWGRVNAVIDEKNSQLHDYMSYHNAD